MKILHLLKPSNQSEIIRATLTLTSLCLATTIFLWIFQIEDELIQILSIISSLSCVILSALGGAFASIWLWSASKKWKQSDLEIFSELLEQNLLRYVITWGITSSSIGSVLGLAFFPGIVVLYALVVPAAPVLAFVFLYFVLIMIPWGFVIFSFTFGFIIVSGIELLLKLSDKTYNLSPKASNS